MTKIQKQIRLIIIATNVFLLLSLYSITVTTFAYGYGEMTYLYLVLYPLFLVSTILVIAKVRLGIILTFFISIIYCLLLITEVGRYFIFNSNNYVLFWILALPYLLFLITIPLATTYLCGKIKFKNLLIIASFIISLSFIIYPIFDRYEKKYITNIFVDAEINKLGLITLNCKPSFGDSRIFVLTSNSNEFQNQIKKYGEHYQGSYFLSNTIVRTNYKFDRLISITIIEFNNHKINSELTWEIDKIKGETNFLTPHN